MWKNNPAMIEKARMCVKAPWMFLYQYIYIWWDTEYLCSVTNGDHTLCDRHVGMMNGNNMCCSSHWVSLNYLNSKSLRDYQKPFPTCCLSCCTSRSFSRFSRATSSWVFFFLEDDNSSSAMLASFSLIAANSASCLWVGNETTWHLTTQVNSSVIIHYSWHKILLPAGKGQNWMTFYKIKVATNKSRVSSTLHECMCAGVLLHLQHLLQVFPALSSQGGEVSLLLTEGLLGAGQLGPHRLQFLLHLLHGPQQLLHLGTHTQIHKHFNYEQRKMDCCNPSEVIGKFIFDELPVWAALIRGRGSRTNVGCWKGVGVDYQTAQSKCIVELHHLFDLPVIYLKGH